jgi:hypothetical protein
LAIKDNICSFPEDMTNDILYVLWYLRASDDAESITKCKSYIPKSTLDYFVYAWLDKKITY